MWPKRKLSLPISFLRHRRKKKRSDSLELNDEKTWGFQSLMQVDGEDWRGLVGQGNLETEVEKLDILMGDPGYHTPSPCNYRPFIICIRSTTAINDCSPRNSYRLRMVYADQKNQQSGCTIATRNSDNLTSTYPRTERSYLSVCLNSARESENRKDGRLTSELLKP